LEPFQALILGIVQGLTEFLPISSSGHLVLFQQLFGLTEPELVFDIAVHMGTLVAVIFYFRDSLVDMLTGLLKFFADWRDNSGAGFPDLSKHQDVKLILLIIAGTIPTAVMGLWFKDHAERIFGSPTLVGAMLLVTGTLLLVTRWLNKNQRGMDQFTIPMAVAIGVIQGMAILPGISRSGSTIALGLFLGLNRELSARFSFLLAIPAVAGAGILGSKDIADGAHFSALVVCIGLVTSALVGYYSLKLLVFIVKKGQMYLFAPYCYVVGIIALLLTVD
jgi:undecaprenyl-diphosphatase